jgi:CTP synthase
MTKYIFITGGVTSSLGKGIISASVAKLIQARGYSVTIQKLDPYINVDPGTLNPYEHGECYVTEDGAETDLDLGHYERFLGQATSQSNNTTTGRIYQTVIQKERAGQFLGKTVQVIPHITDEIKNRIKYLEKDQFDFIITEIGGTVGDIESLPYIEALRQLKWELGTKNCIVVHLTLVPYLKAAKELKTKPTQHSVKELLTYGVQPDILVCRTEHDLNDEIRNKLALFCNVDRNCVIEAKDAETIYDVPILMYKEKLDKRILQKLHVKATQEPNLSSWKSFLGKLKNPISEVTIGLVGKYIELQDAYKSIFESFVHSSAANECRVKVVTIHAESLLTKEDCDKALSSCHGVLVAPGFGERGTEGKIRAIEYARIHKIPFFGICLGMQMAVIEFARNVAGLAHANSTEMSPNTPYPVIDLMENQKNIENYGGTMRLGSYQCEIKSGSKAYAAYRRKEITERHRHRYEFNNAYKDLLEKSGLLISGINPHTELVEMIEVPDHPWFVGVQFHPELKSTVENAHPLFVEFISAAKKIKSQK